jgi:hypothetical protein
MARGASKIAQIDGANLISNYERLSFSDSLFIIPAMNDLKPRHTSLQNLA